MTQPFVSALRRESFALFAPSLRPLPVKVTSGAMVDAIIRDIEKRFCEELDILEEVKEAKNDSKPRRGIQSMDTSLIISDAPHHVLPAFADPTEHGTSRRRGSSREEPWSWVAAETPTLEAGDGGE